MKICKYALISVLFLMTFFSITEVKAEKYTGQAIWPSEHISNIFIKKIKPDGYVKYQQARFLRRSEDNKFVYCLQPYTDIDNNLPYYDVIRSDYATVLNLTEEQWNRISLLAYYGYDYDDNGYDHNAQKWYVITQVLIWRTTNPESRIVFTDTLNGNINESKFASEIAELESLVSNHYKRPSFNSDNLTIPLGQSVTLTDSNNVLQYFRVSSTENATATISGNNLIVTSTGIGTAKVNLVKNASSYEVPPIVYFSNHSQNVFRVGMYDPVPAQLTATVVGGKIEINKLDSSTGNSLPQGEATLQNAVYGIYTTGGDRIATLTTNETGYAISGYLPSLGEFYIQEITASNGYTLDVNKYSFIIDENNLLATVNVYEKVITRDIEITKVYASSETELLTAEVGSVFAFYNKDNIEVTRGTTNSDGKINVTLPYGTYTVKQLTSPKGYEKMQDFELSITELGNTMRYVISNAGLTAKLKVIKVDKDSGNIIERSNIKFKIFNIDTNEYVSQTITYPKAQTLNVFETDDNGILITPYPLEIGNYRLEEVDQAIDGYLWNSESLPFSIDDESNLIIDNEYGVIFETKFENKQVKGSIEVIKTGEELIYENNSYSYNKILLEGVKYNLYASEDIYSADGTKIYEKDELITSAITDETGYFIIENLFLGKYYLLEIESAGGNVIDTTKYVFDLEYKDQYTAIISKELELENHLPKGTLEFIKTDFSTSETLPNTTIEIYTENDELVFSGITDENGMIVIEELPIGKYYILETNAPDGYEINTEKMYFEITEDGQIVKSTMTNELIVVVPNTESNEIPVLKIIAYATIITGIGLIIYEASKKKFK